MADQDGCAYQCRCPAGRETRKATGAIVCVACAPGTSLVDPANDVNCSACAAGEHRGGVWCTCVLGGRAQGEMGLA